MRVGLPAHEVRARDQLAQPLPELRLQRADGQEAAVGAPIDPVARERPRQRAGELRQHVGLVRHRHDESQAPARALPLQQAREHACDRVQSAGREIGDRQRRHRGCDGRERPCPAEVVDVVTDAAIAVAEPRERAVDDAVRHVVRPDAEARGDAGPKPVEHDVGLRADARTEVRIARAIPDDGLLAGVQYSIPLGLDVAQRIAVGRLKPYDARAEPSKLTACERPRQVPRQVHDEGADKRLHYAQNID